MSDRDLLPIPLRNGVDKLTVTHQEEPSTFGQKFDNTLQDFWHRVLKKYWYLWVLLFVIPSFFIFLYFLSSTPNWKTGIQASFQAIGGFIGSMFGLIFGSIGAGIVAFIVAYILAKRLMHSDYIMFEEFDGEAMPILKQRKTSDETILYKNRKSILATLIKGKIKIHIDNETYAGFEAVGEPKTITVDNEEYEVFRVYIMPQKELPGQEKFIKVKNQWRFNPLFKMDKNDIDEYILKSNLPNVNPAKLRKTLVNLTIKNNKLTQRISELEKESEDMIENKFWDYLARQTPNNSYGKELIRKKHKQLLIKDALPDEIIMGEYDKHITSTYHKDEDELEGFVS